MPAGSACRSFRTRRRRCEVDRGVMLLALDVGNTQTVIGLFDSTVAGARNRARTWSDVRRRARRRRRPANPANCADLVQQWRSGDSRRTHRRRVRPARHRAAEPGRDRLQREPGERRRRRDRRVLLGAGRDLGREGDGAQLVRRPPRRHRAGGAHGDADPLRQPEGRRGGPGRQRRRGPRLVRRPRDRRGHGHRDHLRRHLGRGRVRRAGRSPRASRSAWTRCSSTPPPCAASSSSSPAT